MKVDYSQAAFHVPTFAARPYMNSASCTAAAFGELYNGAVGRWLCHEPTHLTSQTFQHTLPTFRSNSL